MHWDPDRGKCMLIRGDGVHDPAGVPERAIRRRYQCAPPCPAEADPDSADRRDRPLGDSLSADRRMVRGGLSRRDAGGGGPLRLARFEGAHRAGQPAASAVDVRPDGLALLEFGGAARFQHPDLPDHPGYRRAAGRPRRLYRAVRHDRPLCGRVDPGDRLLGLARERAFHRRIVLRPRPAGDPRRPRPDGPADLQRSAKAAARAQAAHRAIGGDQARAGPSVAT